MGASNSRPVPVQFPLKNGPIIQKFTEGGENARIKYAVSSMQGWRNDLKDAFAAVPDLDDLTSFFGVYDGHEGADVALLCATQFHTELRNHPDYQRNLSTAIERTFFRMDELLERSEEWKELLPRFNSGRILQRLCSRACICAHHWPFTRREETPYVPPQESGSTACVVAIRGHKIFIGNVGNSRCIISRNGQAIELTTDHQPDLQIEKERIERAGGRVTIDNVRLIPGEAIGFFQQHGLGTPRINGILAHSRAIGDFAFKYNQELGPEDQMATCKPELLTMDITDDIEFLVIVSDGIWTFLSSQGVVDYIRFYLRAGRTGLRTICEKLCDRCVLSADNVTAILVQFKDPSRLPPPPNLPAGDGNKRGNAPPSAPEQKKDDGSGTSGSGNTSGGGNNTGSPTPSAVSSYGTAGSEEQPQHDVSAKHEDDEPEDGEEQPLLRKRNVAATKD